MKGNAMLDKIRSEPVLVTALIQAVLTLVVSFGLQLSADQIGAILACSGAVLAIVARSQVSPATPAPAETPAPPVVPPSV